MLNFGKFLAALVLGLMLSLALLLTSSFAHTTKQSTATQVAAAHTQVITHGTRWGGYGWGGYGWGWSSWGGCCDWGCDWGGGW
jgi:hypothetical protein